MKESEIAMKNQKIYEYCNNIRNQYQDYISLEQFRIICRIAKRTAAHLLGTGVVPCIDNGKKTCRYKIKVDDVIEYLQSVKTVEQVSANGKNYCKIVRPSILKKNYIVFLSEVPQANFLNYLQHTYSLYPDVMTPNDVAEITGLIENTIQHYSRAGYIKTFHINRKHMIPKPYVYEFLMSSKFIESLSPVEFIIKIAHELEEWLERNPVDCGVIS